MKITKYIKFGFFSTALVLTGMSCTKLLDIPPQNKLSFDEFWKSRDQAVAAIAGVYSNLGSTRWDFKNGNQSNLGVSPVECYVYWGDMRGEILSTNPGKLPALQIDKENMDAYIPTANDNLTRYTAFYKIINEANQAIKNIPGIMDKDPAFTSTEETQLMGEAYFLRAYAYFWLVRTFKEVPLVLVPSENDQQDYDVPKASADTLFKQIVADLTLAKKTLPVWYTNDQYNRVRATQYTASTVLADVYLWMAAKGKNTSLNSGYYDQAIANCDAVINSSKYFLLPGVNFADIWMIGNTEEAIFETYSNSLLNNQVNNLKDWFNTKPYFVVNGATDVLFSNEVLPDYRGSGTLVPPGPYPPAGTKVSYNETTRAVLKYNSSTNDARWNFYRYPDVLLMKAEALAHRYMDDPSKLKIASDLVDQVRQRAFGVSTFTKLAVSSTNEMDDALLDERGREFIGEGRRWFDLVRFASRDNFLHKELLTSRVLGAFGGVTQLIISPRITNPESWYLPLNGLALSSNPKLVQNPYYQ